MTENSKYGTIYGENPGGVKRESEKIMKKSFNICFVALALVSILMFSMTSCFGGGNITTITTATTTTTKPHVCVFGDWETIKEATNTEDGLRESRCECGEVKQEVIKASNSEYYIIYRNLKDAAYPEQNGYDSKDGLLDLPQPQATGYKFIGWYTASIGGDLVDYIPRGSNKDYVLYAHWETVSYDIIYKKVPNNTNPTSYTIEDELCLENPKWSGLVFTHWSDENGNIYTPDEDMTIVPEKMSGKLILTANWKVLRNITTPAGDGGQLYQAYNGNDGFLYFFYDLGTIEHVVLDKIDPSLYYKYEGMPLNLTLSKTVTISEETASALSKTVSKSISNSASWTDTTNWAKTHTDQWNSHLGIGLGGELGSGKLLKNVLNWNVKLDIDMAFDTGEVDTETDGWTNSQSGSSGTTDTNSNEITTSIAYKEQITSEITENYSIGAELPSGYYAYVHAGNIRVIAVVSYETATGNLYLNTYSRLDNMHAMIMYYENVHQLNNPTVEGLDFEIPKEEIVDYINNSYYVKYDANGGNGTMPTSLFAIDKNGQLLANSYENNGSEFGGWNTKPDGTGEFYLDGQIINNLTSPCNTVTLYAMWDGLAFTLNDDKASYSVTGIGVCTNTDIVIPSKHLGLPVTSIGQYAFSNCSSITSIDIPSSVTSIESGAFGYSSLKSVHIPSSVKSIGSGTFYNCTELESVTFDSNSPLTSIEPTTFYQCEALKNVNIPVSVKSIGDGAFMYCVSLTSIQLPSLVNSIGNMAFKGCSSLEGIYLPNSITSIGHSAFAECSLLTGINIPSSLTSIDYATFSGCTSLTSIQIPATVTSIGYYAFYECSSLTSVNIPYAVTRINEYTFYGCSSLTGIKMSSTVTSIGDYAFYGCSTITSLTIPAYLTSIGESAFAYCSSIIEVIMPRSVSSIGEKAFYYCTSLDTIHYNGTVAQFNAIQKAYLWGYVNGSFTISCLDDSFTFYGKWG